MTKRVLAQTAFSIAIALAAPRIARADVVPDLCSSSMEGQSCNNALPGNAPGTCQAAKCSSPLPPPLGCFGSGGRGGAPGGGRGGTNAVSGSGGAAGDSGEAGQGGISQQATSSPAGCGNYGTVTRDCYRCVAGGKGGGSTAGAGGNIAGSSAGGATSSGCSCRLGTDDTETEVAGLMLIVGLAALVSSRRRSRAEGSNSGSTPRSE
jgi:MYXO-CTERM domain-containing protein